MSISGKCSFKLVGTELFLMEGDGGSIVVAELNASLHKKSTFNIIRGLAFEDCPQAITFESSETSGKYLVWDDKGDCVKLAHIDDLTYVGPWRFKLLATFLVEPGIAAEEKYHKNNLSFRSHKAPYRFIGAQALGPSKVGLLHEQDPRQATFEMLPPNAVD